MKISFDLDDSVVARLREEAARVDLADREALSRHAGLSMLVPTRRHAVHGSSRAGSFLISGKDSALGPRVDFAG